MRVLVTGSRDWVGVHGATRIQMILNTVLALAEMLGEKLHIVHGGCETGADRITDDWARRREDDGVTVEVHRADWVNYGKPAGFRRNWEMVQLGADMTIGFLRNRSPGTSHTLQLSNNNGIPTFTVHWEQPPPEGH